jgi:hypothetical protein
MRGTIRFLAAFAAFIVSTQGFAANFVCGDVACSPFTTSQPITGIDDLAVGGNLFDVTFSNTLTPSPFLFSYSASGSGQPLTGIDAANALDAFYSSQVGPSGSAGPGIITGTGFVLNYATAYQNSGIPGGMYYLDSRRRARDFARLCVHRTSIVSGYARGTARKARKCGPHGRLDGAGDVAPD